VNGAEPAGSGIRPLQACKSRIEQAELTVTGNQPSQTGGLNG